MSFFDKLMSDKFKERFGSIFQNRIMWHWKNTLKKSIIFYDANNVGLIDIRKVFQMTARGEEILSKVATQFEIIPKDDDRIIAIAKYVNDLIRYEPDLTNYKRVEYWADPYAVWEKKIDDCDGYSVLMAYLGWKSGIPRDRLKVQALTVYKPDGREAGGHANLIYLREEDNEWYTIEGSYYPDKSFSNFKKKIPQRENKIYGKIWWVTDDWQSYAVEDLSVVQL